MPRLLMALVAIAAIVAGIYIYSAGDPTAPGPSDRPNTAGDPPVPVELDTEIERLPRGTIRGTVRREGVGVTANLELYRILSGAKEDRGAINYSSEHWLSRVFSTDESIAAAVAAPDGRYGFDFVSPGEYRVVARAADGATGFARVDLETEGAQGVADIHLASGAHTLRGRLVTAAGDPFPALVWVVPGPRPTTVTKQVGGTAPVRTGSDGRFAIPGLDSGTANVSVLRPDRFFTCYHGVGIPRDDELVLVVDEGFVEVSGRVLAEHDGSPVAGARVSARGRSRGRATNVGATTDEDGSFRTALPPGEIYITVRADGYVPRRTKLRAGTGIEIHLSRWAVVSGRVETVKDGRPVAGVPVRARTLDTGHRSRLKTNTESGPDGRFRLEAQPD